MEKIKIANECLEKLTTIIQEQNNEIEEIEFELFKSKRVMKLLLVLNLNESQKRYICEVFDNILTKDEIKSTYQKLLDELK